MKSITTVLFDVDGTLLNTTDLILSAFEHTFLKHNLPLPERGTFISVSGKPLTECYQILTGVSDVTAFCLSHHEFQIANLHLSQPFEHSLYTLKELKKRSFKIAAVTSRKKESTRKTLQHAGMLNFIDFAVYADEVNNHKPHPEPFLKALSFLNASVDEAVVVGDSEADILGGKNIGSITIAALYGFHGELLKQLSPDYIINDISEVLGILAK